MPDPAGQLLAALQDEDHYAPHRLVIAYGTGYEPAPLPSGVEAGKPNCCFANSYRLASSNDELTYVEGYATTTAGPTMPQRHAWCIDRSGRVVDVTWAELSTPPRAYRGLALPPEIVEPFAYDESRGTLTGMSDRIDEITDALGLDPV
jgi:hypothetical protein